MLITKKNSESKDMLHGFCLFDPGAVWQLYHLSPKYPRIIMLPAKLLNQINKIWETEL